MKTLLSMAATVLFGMYASTAVAGDPEKGEKVFKKCKACHAVGDGAKNKVGPQLNNIVAMLQARLKAPVVSSLGSKRMRHRRRRRSQSPLHAVARPAPAAPVAASRPSLAQCFWVPPTRTMTTTTACFLWSTRTGSRSRRWPQLQRLASLATTICSAVAVPSCHHASIEIAIQFL